MKKAVLLCFLTLALSALGFTTPLPAACVSGTVSSYMSLPSTGCSIGDLVFSNFNFSPMATGVTLPTAADIAVAPSSAASEFGFLFGSAALTTTSGESVSLALTFQVTDSTGANITDSALSVTAAAGSQQSATALVTECLGGTLPACSGGTPGNLGANPGKLMDSNMFAGVSTVGVQATLSASNGGVIASDLLAFSTGSGSPPPVPEPASLLLFGTGALGVGLLLRRRKWLSGVNRSH